jgi:hypothetical protein
LKLIFRLKTSSEHMLTLLEFLTALPEEVWKILIRYLKRFFILKLRSIHQQ